MLSRDGQYDIVTHLVPASAAIWLSELGFIMIDNGVGGDGK